MEISAVHLVVDRRSVRNASSISKGATSGPHVVMTARPSGDRHGETMISARIRALPGRIAIAAGVVINVAMSVTLAAHEMGSGVISRDHVTTDDAINGRRMNAEPAASRIRSSEIREIRRAIEGG